MSPQEIIDQYIECGAILTETTLNGDYKRGNKVTKKMEKLFNIFAQDKDLATFILTQVMDSNVDKARSIAAVEALQLNIAIEKAVNVLEEVSKRSDIIGLGPKYALMRLRGEIPNKTQ